MTVQRRQLLRLALLGIAAGSGCPRSALALDYPDRPVRIIVGFTAGGGSDLLARMLAQWMSERLREPFVVENHPVAGGKLATEVVVHAAPDG